MKRSGVLKRHHLLCGRLPKWRIRCTRSSEPGHRRGGAFQTQLQLPLQPLKPLLQCSRVQELNLQYEMYKRLSSFTAYLYAPASLTPYGHGHDLYPSLPVACGVLRVAFFSWSALRDYSCIAVHIYVAFGVMFR